MVTADSIVGVVIFGLAGAAVNTAIRDEGGFFNCFDIEQGKKIKAIQKFWHKHLDQLF